MNISVVIPIYNEKENLHLLYERLNNVLSKSDLSYEVILVNDGSADNSLDIIKGFAAKDEHIKFIDLSRNFGHQIAIYTGLDLSEGDTVLIMDGDLQDPPELIPELYGKLKEGYQVVYAKRRTRKGVSIFKKLAYKYFYKILGSITDIDIPLDTGDFRIIDKEIVQYLREMPEQPKFLRGQIAWLGFNQTMYEYDRDERHGGDPGYTFKKLVRLALDGITQFSDTPLKFASLLGLIIAGVAFVFMIWAIAVQFVKLNNPPPPGWSSIMVGILFLGGIQLITVGIIGEYISRISSSAKNRPVYIVNESNIKDRIKR